MRGLLLELGGEEAAVLVVRQNRSMSSYSRSISSRAISRRRRGRCRARAGRRARGRAHSGRAAPRPAIPRSAAETPASPARAARRPWSGHSPSAPAASGQRRAPTATSVTSDKPGTRYKFQILRAMRRRKKKNVYGVPGIQGRRGGRGARRPRPAGLRQVEAGGGRRVPKAFQVFVRGRGFRGATARRRIRPAPGRARNGCPRGASPCAQDVR